MAFIGIASSITSAVAARLARIGGGAVARRAVRPQDRPFHSPRGLRRGTTASAGSRSMRSSATAWLALPVFSTPIVPVVETACRRSRRAAGAVRGATSQFFQRRGGSSPPVPRPAYPPRLHRARPIRPSIATHVSPAKIATASLLGMMAARPSCRGDAYLVPQPAHLPMANSRDDLIIGSHEHLASVAR